MHEVYPPNQARACPKRKGTFQSGGSIVALALSRRVTGRYRDSIPSHLSSWTCLPPYETASVTRSKREWRAPASGKNS